VVDAASRLPIAEAEALLDRVALIDLFSRDFLPGLQILRCPPNVDPDLHAYDIAMLIARGTEADIGVRQEAGLVPVIECLVRAGLPITVLPTALEYPELLRRLGQDRERKDLYHAAARRLERESKERIAGLLSRTSRLLRLRSTRLAMGGASGCLDFGEVFDKHLALISVAPPHGSPDIGRFTQGLLWLQLTHAIRRRPNGSPPVIVVIDEFPAFLRGAGVNAADLIEDILRLARSKGVFLWMLSQDVASVAKLASSLPEIMRSNVHLHAIFRSATPNAWDFALPVTGERMRRKRPWEDQTPRYLERGAELSLLREELGKLPDRECYFVDRRTGLPGVRLRTADLSIKASAAEVRALERRAAESPLVVPVAELERGLEDTRAMVQKLVGGESGPEGPDGMNGPVPVRRRRGLGIG